ncbi:MAG: hypothetical protein AB1540_01335 [Bdellovibrionota bacterium]
MKQSAFVVVLAGLVLSGAGCDRNRDDSNLVPRVPSQDSSSHSREEAGGTEQESADLSESDTVQSDSQSTEESQALNEQEISPGSSERREVTTQAQRTAREGKKRAKKAETELKRKKDQARSQFESLEEERIGRSEAEKTSQGMEEPPSVETTETFGSIDEESIEREPASEQMLSMEEKRRRYCSDTKHPTAHFLRQDLAYSILGVDCHGDPATSYTIRYGLPHGVQNLREPAAASKDQCDSSPHAHPMGLRSDFEYHVTGRDCQGDRPMNAFDLGLTRD